MKILTRGRYGTYLMVDLAQHYGEGPITLREIATRQDLPEKYLEQMIFPLKRGGLIRGIRGRRGGYTLARKPEEISVGKIIEIMEGGFDLVYCVTRPELCDRSAGCPTRNIWVELTNLLKKHLFSMSLQDILNRSDLPCPPP